MNKTKNTRYIETENSIFSAMTALLDEKPYKKITVNDICKKCNINRFSFYIHFEDIPSLMIKLQEKIFSDITSTFSSDQKENSVSNMFNKDNLIIILAHIKANSNFYRAWLNHSLSMNVEDMVELLFENVIRKSFSNLGFTLEDDKDERAMRYHFDFFIAGFTQIIKDWLDYDCPESPKELAEIIASHTL